MKNFVKLSAAVNSKNVECMRLLKDQVETSVRNLKTLGVAINAYRSLLIFFFLMICVNVVKNELESVNRTNRTLSSPSLQKPWGSAFLWLQHSSCEFNIPPWYGVMGVDNYIIEKVDTAADNKELVYYLSLYTVVLRDKKTSKVRVDFKCFFEVESSAIT